MLNTAVSTKICVILYAILNTTLYIINIVNELVNIIGIVTIKIDNADIIKGFLLCSSLIYFFTNDDVMRPKCYYN